jgi:hypothetical protein
MPSRLSVTTPDFETHDSTSACIMHGLHGLHVMCQSATRQRCIEFVHEGITWPISTFVEWKVPVWVANRPAPHWGVVACVMKPELTPNQNAFGDSVALTAVQALPSVPALLSSAVHMQCKTMINTLQGHDECSVWRRRSLRDSMLSWCSNP